MSIPYGGYSYSDPARARVRPSPIFMAVLAFAAVTGFVSWQATSASVGVRFVVFCFVMACWVVTLCLHEFAHAFGALLAGDREVEARGYLTLNPLKYANPVLSILLPVLFIAIGGIGLPGGAVYLHSHRFRSDLQRALVSVAGPLVNLVAAVGLMVVVKQYGSYSSHFVFWTALSFLAYLQLTAAILNLLPIPGLDGYGAIESYLSPETRRLGEQIKPFGMLGLFVLLQLGSVNRVFFDALYSLYEVSGLPRIGVQYGYTLVQFWR